MTVNSGAVLSNSTKVASLNLFKSVLWRSSCACVEFFIVHRLPVQSKNIHVWITGHFKLHCDYGWAF